MTKLNRLSNAVAAGIEHVDTIANLIRCRPEVRKALPDDVIEALATLEDWACKAAEELPD